MFKLCLDNGLPAKPYKFVEHFDDYEETDEYKKKNVHIDNLKKIVVIALAHIPEESIKFKETYFVNNQLWIDFGENYIICKSLSEKTIKHINNFGFINLGIYDDENKNTYITKNINVNCIKK